MPEPIIHSDAQELVVSEPRHRHPRKAQVEVHNTQEAQASGSGRTFWEKVAVMTSQSVLQILVVAVVFGMMQMNKDQHRDVMNFLGRVLDRMESNEQRTDEKFNKIQEDIRTLAAKK